MNSEVTEIKLKRFDPKKIDPCRTCMIIAKRGTGKSVLIRDLMWHLKDKLPFGMCMSGSEIGNGFYGEMMPKSFVYDDFDENACQKLVMRQQYMVQNKKKNPESFLILDDLMTESKKIVKDPSIRTIFLNGRHFKLLFIMALQYSMEINPTIRANIDYVFVLRENIIANQEKLWKHFFGVFPNVHSFIQTMNACTQDFGILVLDNTSTSNKIEDCVFHYKASMHPKFKLCSEQAWKIHRRIYNENDHKISLQSLNGIQSSAKPTSRKTTYSVVQSSNNKESKKKESDKNKKHSTDLKINISQKKKR
tara:strand:+ start:459 stop:1376 length:918 start_codon:yes stop_codon:yes gene_type:complete